MEPPIASRTQPEIYNDISYRSILGVCTSSVESWCIESVEVIQNGVAYTAIPGDEIKTSTSTGIFCAKFPEVPVGSGLVVRSDGCPRRWTVAGLPELSSFITNVGVTGFGSFNTSWINGQGLIRPNKKDQLIAPTDMDVSIIPLGQTSDLFCAQQPLQSPVLQGPRPTNNATQTNGVITHPMLQNTSNTCTYNWTDASYKVKIRHTIDLRGWAFGRMSSAVFSVVTTPNGFTTTISG
jgi:hypothetical protein